MTITKPTPKSTNAAGLFISGASDAECKPKGMKKDYKRKISLTIAPTLLTKIDELAAELEQSRAAVINMDIYRAVEHGLVIKGLRKT